MTNKEYADLIAENNSKIKELIQTKLDTNEKWSEEHGPYKIDSTISAPTYLYTQKPHLKGCKIKVYSIEPTYSEAGEIWYWRIMAFIGKEPIFWNEPLEL